MYNVKCNFFSMCTHTTIIYHGYQVITAHFRGGKKKKSDKNENCWGSDFEAKFESVI